jgi:FKBP-type peptidyl-prolyl cis-trans isomerase FklB
MQTTKEKVSYCIGLETGTTLKQQFADIDFKLLIKGLQDGFTGATPQLSSDEVHSILIALRNQMETQQKEFIAKLSEENRKKSEQFLLENKQKEGVVTLSSGLQYKILNAAPATAESPKLLDSARIHYRGTFIDGKVFDSSYERGQPLTFPLNRVIPGWSEVLQKMKVGDKWQVFIPPYLAYGENGFGPHIAPNTCLIFEIELLGINDTPIPS